MRINCAPSWFHLQDYIEMHGKTEHKTEKLCLPPLHIKHWLKKKFHQGNGPKYNFPSHNNDIIPAPPGDNKQFCDVYPSQWTTVPKVTDIHYQQLWFKTQISLFLSVLFIHTVNS